MNKNYRFILVDALVTICALYIAFLIRFEFKIPQQFLPVLKAWSSWFVAINVIVFYFSGLYSILWRYTSLFDLYAIIRSNSYAFAL